MYLLRRIGAFIVDIAVVALLLLAIDALLRSDGWVVLNAGVYLVYRSVPGSLIGQQTFGRNLFVLDIVGSVEGDARPSFAKLVIREAPVAAVLLSPLVGFPWGLPWGLVLLFSVGPWIPIIDMVFVASRKDRRSWRDLLAGTRVVDNPILHPTRSSP